MTFPVSPLPLASSLRTSRQRRRVRRQRCRGRPASATPSSSFGWFAKARSASGNGVAGAKGLRLAPLPPHSMTLARMMVVCMVSLLCNVSAWSQTEAATKTANWPYKTYDTVIGYQFRNPEHHSLVAVIFGKSGMVELNKLKTKEAHLNKLETSELLGGCFDAPQVMEVAFCYDPHHIFVFFSSGSPVATIEVCFSCGEVRAWPKNARVNHNDFERLRSLASSKGLGTNNPDTKPVPNKSSPDTSAQIGRAHV